MCHALLFLFSYLSFSNQNRNALTTDTNTAKTITDGLKSPRVINITRMAYMEPQLNAVMNNVDII